MAVAAFGFANIAGVAGLGEQIPHIKSVYAFENLHRRVLGVIRTRVTGWLMLQEQVRNGLRYRYLSLLTVAGISKIGIQYLSIAVITRKAIVVFAFV